MLDSVRYLNITKLHLVTWIMLPSSGKNGEENLSVGQLG
jgi:hypothetical protein